MADGEMVAWLNACYDRAEQRAQAADVKQGDPEWWVSPVRAAPGHFTVRSKRDMRPIAQVQHLDGDDDDPVILDGAAAAQHIADLDPSWRLADIGRKRKILDMHEIEWGLSEYAQSWGKGEGKPFGCAVCHTHDGIIVGDGYCTTARLLAEEFAAEPGYQESWRP